MATAEWARSLNDETLRFARNKSNRRLHDAQQELAAARQEHEVLTAEARRRMIDDGQEVAHPGPPQSGVSATQ